MKQKSQEVKCGETGMESSFRHSQFNRSQKMSNSDGLSASPAPIQSCQKLFFWTEMCGECVMFA